MKLILKHLKNYKALLLLNVISVFGFALVELGIPTVIAVMIDKGVVTGDKGYLFRMGGIIAIISVLGAGGTILLGYCCARISTLVTRDIRLEAFKKVQSLSHAEMNQLGVSSLITRTNNDAYQIMMFLNTILKMALLTPVMIISSYILIIQTSLSLSFIVLATVPLVVGGVIIAAKISSPISEKQQMSLDSINRIFRENLTGIRVIRSCNNNEYETSRFDTENKFFMKQSKKLFCLMSTTEPIFFLLMNMAAIAIYYVSAKMIDANTIQVGRVVAFMDYLFHAMLSVMLFCMVFMMYPRANVSAKRIMEVLNMESSIQNSPQIIEENKKESSIVFDDVTFAYPDGEEAVLKHISFEAKKGETVAFIGSTGSGKSTLINLIPRFYDVNAGAILINGVNIKEYDIEILRNKIGFVSQKATLFRGTIEENIRFGKEDATMEEIIHAAKVAQAYDFIMEKPEGFKEMIVEGATNLSGGQKQRLSIARALVRKPEIYIYDDSFSALDFKTDATLRRQLKKEVKDSIMLIVAQRVSTIMDATQIIVLDEGKVVGKGTHKELLQSCPIYYQIAASQLSEEEMQHE